MAEVDTSNASPKPRQRSGKWLNPLDFRKARDCTAPEKRALLPCGFPGRKVAKALYYRGFSARMIT
jgi:hypothetical protein